MGRHDHAGRSPGCSTAFRSPPWCSFAWPWVCCCCGKITATWQKGGRDGCSSNRLFLFKYDGFSWVQPLPPGPHQAVFYALAVLAVGVTLGLAYRACAALLFLGWGYVFLLDQSLYLNHLYLVVLVTGLAAFLPANRALSLDAKLRPSIRTETVSRWTLAVLRAEIGLVYFFGGVAKLNADWLSGVPMQLMLVDRGDVLGQTAGEPWAAYLFAYGGLTFDLLIVPLLWWNRTRLPALAAAVGFHLANHFLFRIGVFPWFMLAATLILWPPRRLSLLGFARLYSVLVTIGLLLAFAADRNVPGWGAVAAVGAMVVLWILPDWRPPVVKQDDPVSRADLPIPAVKPGRGERLVVAGMMCLLAWQCVMPLRHWAYPGDVSWTEQGHKWSWHMKLRVKVPTEATFFVLDRDGHLLAMIDPRGPQSPLTPTQARTMATRPELILQFAHFLADDWRRRAGGPVKVTANVRVSLNDRPPAHLIDPEVDLATVESTLWPPANWILPLETPLRPLGRVDIAERMRLRAAESPPDPEAGAE